MDRTYWHVPGARSWHASVFHRCGIEEAAVAWGLACGRWINLPRDAGVECADRLPPTAHLCGNCSRVIAARTDIEGKRADFKRTELERVVDLVDAAVARSEDVPEPVASEQDDS